MFLYLFMKTLKLFIVGLLLVATASCKKGKVTRIKTSDGKNLVEITYSGRIVFDEAAARIKNMAPESYINYKKSGRELNVECDAAGHVTYTLDNGDKVSTLSADDEQFFAEAIKTIAEQKIARR